MLLGAAKANHPVFTIDRQTEQRAGARGRRPEGIESSGSGNRGTAERARIAPEGLRSMHYYKVHCRYSTLSSEFVIVVVIV